VTWWTWKYQTLVVIPSREEETRFPRMMELFCKSQSNRIYAGGFSGAELETCWRQESIAGTETVRKRIS
jgi:hypothetical protein